MLSFYKATDTPIYTGNRMCSRYRLPLTDISVVCGVEAVTASCYTISPDQDYGAGLVDLCGLWPRDPVYPRIVVQWKNGMKT